MSSAVKLQRSARLRRRYKVTLQHGPSFTVDVSEGGFCTELVRVLPPGTVVDGTIQVKGVDYPFLGRVIWAMRGSPHIGLRGRMGVQLQRSAAPMVA